MDDRRCKSGWPKILPVVASATRSWAVTS